MKPIHSLIPPLFLIACSGEAPVELALSADSDWTGEAREAVAAWDRDESVSDAIVLVGRLRLRWSPDPDGPEEEADDDERWEEIELLDPQPIDLVALGDGQVVELARTRMPPGELTELRLVLASDAESYVVLADGSEAPMHTPSGTASGLKAKGRVRVEADSGPLVRARIEAESSLHPTGEGTWVLHPVLVLESWDAVGEEP